MSQMVILIQIVKSASYLDLHLEIDNKGRLKTTIYDNIYLPTDMIFPG